MTTALSFYSWRRFADFNLPKRWDFCFKTTFFRKVILSA